MAKKNKRKKRKMPPLSGLDKTIYGLLAILGTVLVLCFALIPVFYTSFFVFSDVQVIACREHASVLWALPLGLYLSVTLIAFFDRGYGDRIPIFGKRGFKYGPPNWVPVYPIFMKNKPYRWVSEKAKEMRWWSVKIWLVGFVICLVFYPLAFFGRTCLMQDGSVQVYNAFNQVTEKYLPEQMESVTFDTASIRVMRRKRLPDDWRWMCVMQLTATDGETYYFSQKYFENSFETLEEMKLLKEQYPPEILRYDGTEHLESVAADHDYTEEETKMLYELYAVPVADYPWYIQ